MHATKPATTHEPISTAECCGAQTRIASKKGPTGLNPKAKRMTLQLERIIRKKMIENRESIFQKWETDSSIFRSPDGPTAKLLGQRSMEAGAEAHKVSEKLAYADNSRACISRFDFCRLSERKNVPPCTQPELATAVDTR